MTDTIRIQHHKSLTGVIGHIELNRPEALNALSIEMIRTITETLTAWQMDPAIEVVVFSSSSSKAFCAGGDIKWIYHVGREDKNGALSFFSGRI